jgi:signal transduction histidine kinase
MSPCKATRLHGEACTRLKRKKIVSAIGETFTLDHEGKTPAMPVSAPRPETEEAPEATAAATLEAQKRAFLRLVTHELRTPLNSILGFSEILSCELYGPLGAPQYKEYAEIIRGSGKRLLRLVNQVLEIGRLQGLKLELRPEPLEPALEEAIAAVADDLAERNLKTRVIAAEPRLLVLADPWGLKTVLTNLLQNAAAFSPPGGEVRLRVGVEAGFVSVDVEDDGEGVDPADLPRLTQPFEQGDNALARRGEGAGLGLTICELTCGAMGAQFSLSSPPGRGLTARMRLRAA